MARLLRHEKGRGGPRMHAVHLFERRNAEGEEDEVDEGDEGRERP